MDKWIARIEELFSFLSDVATVWFVIRSLSGLTFRQIISRLVTREKAPPPTVYNTTITPPAGTLCINVFDTVSLGGSASCSATLS
jgi:hypothetical protein